MSASPPTSACASPTGRPTAVTGCCGRQATSGRGCWTPTGSDSSRASGRLPPTRRCAASSPARDRSGNSRWWGTVGAAPLRRRLVPGRETPQGRPAGTPGSRAASAPWSQSAFTTAPSRSRAAGCGCRSPRASRSCGCGWPAPCRIRPSRSGRSLCLPMVGGCGWRSPPPFPASNTTWTPAGSPGSTLRTRRPPRQGRQAGAQARAAWVAAVETQPGPPAPCRGPPSPPRPAGPARGRQAGGRLRRAAPGWDLGDRDLRASPGTTPGGCRISGCGGGAAPTCYKHCATRPSRPGWCCGWWTSEVPPPPARRAGGGSLSPRAASFTVRIAGFRGTGIWWVPATSPPRLAADPRARVCLCPSSTVGLASCRHGVTDAATSTISGGVSSAWPRATQTSLLARLGVARRTGRHTGSRRRRTARPRWRRGRRPGGRRASRPGRGRSRAAR
jgi:hypothetical protein